MTKFIQMNDLIIDQKDIVGDFLSSIVWILKQQFLIETNVLRHNLYSLDGYDTIVDFVNKYFNDIDLNTYDFDIYNNKMLEWCKDHYECDGSDCNFLEIVFTKVLNNIINNIINTKGKIDNCIEDYNDIVKSCNESDVSRKILTYFHMFIKQQISYVKEGLYNLDNINSKIDLSKYNIHNNEIIIPKYIENVYITLIQNPAIKSMLNKKVITQDTEEHSLLFNTYFKHMNMDGKYTKLMAYYISNSEFNLAEIYLTTLGDFKIVKRNTY